jgi:hypothetical protein
VTEYGYEIWNMERKEYRVGSLMTVLREPRKYKLDLVEVQKVTWEDSGSEAKSMPDLTI